MNFTKLSFATWILVIAAPCFASQDSVKVVKGQVSDYYIPVVNEYELTGIVTDEHDQPLEGATVMFFASPAHCNTDAAGRYTLKATDHDRHLYVYYPGKSFSNIIREKAQKVINIKMTAPVQPRSFLHRKKAQTTPWYHPYKEKTNTYCNPMNISYNYEPYNNNVKTNGSFRSSADPMAVMYKDQYLLFSTNQGGFHY